MLVLIPQELETQISDICATASVAKLRGITNLLQAYADSRHIVVAPPSICRIFEQCARLSEEHRGVAKKIRQRFSEFTELQNILPIYSVVSLIGEAPRIVSKVWTLPLDWIATHGLSETNLICEDLYDCELSHEAARDFLNLSDLGQLKLALDHNPGGGGNTHRVLKVKAIDGQRVSVCVVDSDRAEPSSVAPLGNTADLCKKVTGQGLYELQISFGRELENDIPIRLVDKVRKSWHDTIPSIAYTSFCQKCPDLILFSDLKSGVKMWDIARMTGEEKIFWESAIHDLPQCATKCCTAACPARNQGDCRHVIVQPMGRSLLKAVNDYLKLAHHSQTKRHREYLPSPNDAFWTHLGGRIAAYGISVKVASSM